MTTYEALQEAFEHSQYLHSVGSGDEQAINDLRPIIVSDLTDEESVIFLGGALMARAMTTDLVVMEIAENLLDSWMEE